MKLGKIVAAPLAALVALAVCAPRVPLPKASAEREYVPSAATIAEMKSDYYSFEPVDPGLLSYGDYLEFYSSAPRPKSEISLSGADYTSFTGETAGETYSADGVSKDGALVWTNSSGEVVYDIEVPETGLYCLEVSYCALLSNASDAEFSMTVDGRLPFASAGRLYLPRVWTNEREIYKDRRGNQIRPSQTQVEKWQERWVGDPDGLFGEPLAFYLEKGSHSVAFSSDRAQVALAGLRFAVPDEIPDYEGYAASVKAPVTVESTPSRLFRVEGENAVYKSDPALYPTTDNNNYLVSPSDPCKVVYNTLGGDGWNKSLQSATWTIPKELIGNDGWYKIGVKARQKKIRGFYSNRRLYIDGKVPCKEASQLKFRYGTDWSVVSPETGDGGDVYVYLDASSDHTLTLEAVPGEIGGFMRRLDEAVSDLDVCYRKILMITGPVPDKYTDYYVHEKVPGLVDELERLSGELKDVRSGIEELAGSSGSEAAALGNLAVVLDKCADKPLKIPDYLPQIKDGLASVSAWTKEYRSQPLEVDYIEFASADRDFASCERKLGKTLKFGWDAFIGSFFEDYSTLSDVTGGEAIEVWVALGRDQAQIVKEMTESLFIPEYGVSVSVNLVVGGVVEASLAGKGPDVALFLGGEFPVNLAARGLLTDMTRFPDFEEVKKRFQKNATVQYSYDGGCYGLPVSQNWPMLFYRTDILAELGFDHPPETWRELTDMLPAIQRAYMNAGLVLPSTNVSPATEAGHTFALLMLQKGLGYYDEGQTRTNFDSVEAVQAFEQWTDYYTKYGFEQTYDAFSRFRTGEYPLLIANYTFFNQLEEAAPEIKGLWDLCPVPGTERGDGTVSHAANSNGSGAVIFDKVSDKDGAWEFVKWFTSADVQAEFGRRVEGLSGRMGRFDAANTEALGKLSWSADELARLEAQRDELEEIPVIPASYATTRNIMNAFREAVNEKENPRDVLLWYDKDINEEIERKRRNLGLD